MMITRNQFLRALLGATAGALGASALAACGSDPEPSPDASAGTCTTPTNTIGTNHPAPHAMTVTIDDVNAGVDKTYDITGSSIHSHSVRITAVHFAQLKTGQPITVSSTGSTGGPHEHMVTVRCTS